MSEPKLRLAWPVFKHYEIKDLRLQPLVRPTHSKKGKREKYDPTQEPTIYFPSERTELPARIATLKRDDHMSLLKFAHQYGSLGFSDLSLDETKPYGDPVQWIWLHAETLQLALSLKTLIDGQETDKLERLLFELPQGAKRDKDYPNPVLTLASLDKQQTTFFFPSSGPSRDATLQTIFFPTSGPSRTAVLQTMATDILRTIINSNIANLRPAVNWDAKDRTFRHQFQFTALIEVAYWHVANVLQGGLVQRCERSDCRQLFIRTDGRQRYCPTGDKRESPCAVLDRVRHNRAKDRQNQQKKGVKHHGRKKR